MSMDASPPASGLGIFGKLSPEIRTLIYEAYFGTEGLVQEHPHISEQIEDGIERVYLKRYDRNILLSSREIHDEAKPYEGQYVCLDVCDLSRRISQSLCRRAKVLIVHDCGQVETDAYGWRFDDTAWPTLREFRHEYIDTDDADPDGNWSVNDIFKGKHDGEILSAFRNSLGVLDGEMPVVGDKTSSKPYVMKLGSTITLNVADDDCYMDFDIIINNGKYSIGQRKSDGPGFGFRIKENGEPEYYITPKA